MNLTEYIKENMVLIPKGQELIRDFVDPVKWLSSDYKMSAPGTRKGKNTREELVDVSSFLLLKTTVTNELYSYVTGVDYDVKMKDYPVVNVSWVEAIEFCNRLSEKLGLEKCYILNSVSEKTIVDYSKNGFRLPTDVEWHEKNSEKRLQEVKMKRANDFGLFDMIGNVWEWCFDLYDEKRYGNYRIFRGGSFASEERACGATSRRKSFPEFKIDDLGFRIARSSFSGLK